MICQSKRLRYLNSCLTIRKETKDKEYSRKEKSLGELCKRFLVLYGREEQDLLYLDSCTKELAVERRRIYDIINILESF
jgi:transcription factor E2F7/8